MVATQRSGSTVLESGETKVVVEYGDDGHARLDVIANGYRRGSAEAGQLACEAIHQARVRHADRIDGALDASSPTCGAILEALQRQLGNDVESIAMRRAGSSVMVTLTMHPTAATADPPQRVDTSLVPTQPNGSQRISRAGIPAPVG